MAQLTHVPSLVAALPVALALPGVIFALPAGAVADVTDLRLVVLTAKFLYLLGMVGLALLAFGGALSPFALLVFAAWLGTVGTFSSPAYWSTIHQLVPERLLSRAFSLDGLQWNIGQVIGPVLGGALLAALGPGGMFAIAAGLISTIVAFLYIWRGRQRTRLTTPGEGSAEAVIGAVAAGLRYLGNAPVLQVICWRTVLFVLPVRRPHVPVAPARVAGSGPRLGRLWPLAGRRRRRLGQLPPWSCPGCTSASRSTPCWPWPASSRPAARCSWRSSTKGRWPPWRWPFSAPPGSCR